MLSNYLNNISLYSEQQGGGAANQDKSDAVAAQNGGDTAVAAQDVTGPSNTGGVGSDEEEAQG